MRALILLAGAALGLGACGNNDQSDNSMNLDENLTAENIVSNDVTAIDAVTADAANMAADVDINFTNQMLDGGGNAAGRTGRPGAARASGAGSTRPIGPATSPGPAQPTEPPADPVSNAGE